MEGCNYRKPPIWSSVTRRTKSRRRRRHHQLELYCIADVASKPLQIRTERSNDEDDEDDDEDDEELQGQLKAESAGQLVS